jgi:hypothetical protein
VLSEIQSIKESVDEAHWDGQRIIGLAETSYKSKIIQNIITRFNGKQSTAVAGGGAALHIVSNLFFDFFVEQF